MLLLSSTATGRTLASARQATRPAAASNSIPRAGHTHTSTSLPTPAPHPHLPRRTLHHSLATHGRATRSHTHASAAAIPAFLQDPPVLPQRVGHGFDLHRLAEGHRLVIGGIEIPHTKGCVAHSDGDVLLHTVTDAVLGALCLPDIGQLFPDTDPMWKGASSDRFLAEVRLMEERGYMVGNLDCTIIAEKPKLSPHKENIRNNVARLLKAHASVVNIKAKTHEKVDSIGEERSIACHAIIMLIHTDVAPARPSLLSGAVVPETSAVASVSSLWDSEDTN